MRIISFGLAVILAFNAYGLAYSEEPQPDTQQPITNGTKLAERAKTEIQKRGVGEKSRVTIRLRDRTEVKGYVSQIDATSFQVTDKKTRKVATVAYDTVERVKGAGLPRGAKIGIGVGVGVAAAAIVLGLVAASFHGN